MAIVIKQDEINLLIYRYLLEAGLQHTAYSLFNEAKIENIYRPFENELKAGHLIHHLERSLIFNQIESHIYLSQYCECRQPMELIKPHICAVVKKKNNIKLEIENGRENLPLQAIARTESLVESKGVYQPNGQSSFPVIDSAYLRNNLSHQKLETTQEFNVYDWNPSTSTFHLYEEKHNWIKIIQMNTQMISQPFTTVQIFPCIIGETFHKPKFISWEKKQQMYLIVVYEDGYIQVMDRRHTPVNICQIEQTENLKAIKWNPDFNNVVALEFADAFEIMEVPTLNSLRHVHENVVQFEWIFQNKFAYLTTTQNIFISTITDSSIQHTLRVDTGTTCFSLSHNNTLISSFSPAENSVKVWTLTETAYALDFVDEEEIKFCVWCKANPEGIGSMLLLVTDKSVKVWDVEFGELKQTIDFKGQIQSYFMTEGTKKQDLLILITEYMEKQKLIVIDQMDKNKLEIPITGGIKKLQKLNGEDTLIIHADDMMILNFKLLESSFITTAFPANY